MYINTVFRDAISDLTLIISAEEKKFSFKSKMIKECVLKNIQKCQNETFAAQLKSGECGVHVHIVYIENQIRTLHQMRKKHCTYHTTTQPHLI